MCPTRSQVLGLLDLVNGATQLCLPSACPPSCGVTTILFRGRPHPMDAVSSVALSSGWTCASVAQALGLSSAVPGALSCV